MTEKKVWMNLEAGPKLICKEEYSGLNLPMQDILHGVFCA